MKKHILIVLSALTFSTFNLVYAQDQFTSLFQLTLKPKIEINLSVVQPPLIILELQLYFSRATSELQNKLLKILQDDTQPEYSQAYALQTYRLIPNQALVDCLRNQALAEDFSAEKWLTLLTLENGNITPLLQQSFAAHKQSSDWKIIFPARTTGYWLMNNSKSSTINLLNFVKKEGPELFRLIAARGDMDPDVTSEELAMAFYQKELDKIGTNFYNPIISDFSTRKINSILGIFFNPTYSPVFFYCTDPVMCEKHGTEYQNLEARYITLRSLNSRIKKLDWLPSEVTTYIADEYAKLAPKFAEKEKKIAEAEAAYIAQSSDQATTEPTEK